MKTPVFVILNRKPIPAFINGDLAFRRANGITKALVYTFDAAGDMSVDLVSLRNIRPTQFELEG